jgi:hypothetical protein
LGLGAIGYKNIHVNFIDIIYSDTVQLNSICDDFKSMLVTRNIARILPAEFRCNLRFYDDFRSYVYESSKDPDLKSHVFMLVDPEFGFSLKFMVEVEDGHIIEENGKRDSFCTYFEVFEVNKFSGELCPMFFLNLPLFENGWVVEPECIREKLVSIVELKSCVVNLCKECCFHDPLPKLISLLRSKSGRFFFKGLRSIYKEYDLLVKYTAQKNALMFGLTGHEKDSRFVLVGPEGEFQTELKVSEVDIGDFSKLWKYADCFSFYYIDRSLMELYKIYRNMFFRDRAHGIGGKTLSNGILLWKEDDTLLSQIVSSDCFRILKTDSVVLCKPSGAIRGVGASNSAGAAGGGL